MHYWDDPWFRKQHFMSRFVKNGYKVAYIEPTFSTVRKLDKHRIKYQTNRLFQVSYKKKDDNLFIIKPPRSLPFGSNPIISRLNYIYFAFVINKVLRKLNFVNYILWIYRPEYAHALNIFKYRKLVFDITDDFPAYKEKKPNKYKYLKECTEIVGKRSNLVIVTASVLLRKYKDIFDNICLIPNGYDSNLFSGKIEKVPDDIRKIKPPIIGFIGTLFSFIDYKLLGYIIKNNPDKSFVFIGNCEDNCKNEWTEIIQYNNVYWLGKKKKEDIPAYINRFDVCLNPFKVCDVSKSVSPLKVFEYLAMKKPLVSVRMKSLEDEDVAPFINFASSYSDFNEKLNIALREKETFKEILNYQVVRKYSWDNLFEKVLYSVEKL